MYQIEFDHPVHVHFIGIGGISMSGLAAVLIKEGFPVSGSDSQRTPLTEWLEEKGAVVFCGQAADNIPADCDVVVYTAAIHPDNPEYAAAVSRGLPMLTRAQLLGEIMQNYDMPIAVSGTHGKTTTTSMLSHITMEAGLDPTISVGGILKSIGGNIRVGSSETFITEACEYTNSFLSLHPKIGIILNVDADHLDFFKNIEEIRRSFRAFAELIPSDGLLIIYGNTPHVEEITDGLACRIVTFGDSSCDYFAENISYDDTGCASFDVRHGNDPVGRFRLQVPGEHNVTNALSAIAASQALGIETPVIVRGLASFTGTDRRFELKGKTGGVTIIDDYAHHPTEIRATLQAAAGYPHRRLLCVFQPHTYTRTQALLDDFARALTLADQVILADIYAAREKNTLGISSEDLQKKIIALGKDALYFPEFSKIEEWLKANMKEGDLVITMGAGNVWQIGEDLLQS